MAVSSSTTTAKTATAYEKEEKKHRTYYCHTCDKTVKVGIFDDPEYWFYQVKSRGTTRYVIDYAFCSNVCMSKYLSRKRRKE